MKNTTSATAATAIIAATKTAAGIMKRNAVSSNNPAVLYGVRLKSLNKRLTTAIAEKTRSPSPLFVFCVSALKYVLKSAQHLYYFLS